MTRKMGTVRGWRCPNVQLYGVLGLRELIGDRWTAFTLWWLFNELTLEDVIPICLQTIQNALEVGDVPGVRKLQRVKSFEEYPFCMWRDGRNVAPVTSIEKAKMASLLSSRKR